MPPIDVIVDYLVEHRLKVATAECGTGGLIVSEILRTTGGRGVLEHGIFAQSSEAQARHLGVHDQLRHEHGSNSDVAAAAMVQRLMRSSAANIVIANTEIEPCTPAEPEGPGRAVLGWGIRRDARSRIHIKSCVFEGDAFEQRLEATYSGLREAIRLHGEF